MEQFILYLLICDLFSRNFESVIHRLFIFPEFTRLLTVDFLFVQAPSTDQFHNANNVDPKIETPHVKKRHRRMKSSGTKNLDFDENEGSYVFRKK